jgi:predicted Ser/Thr protein kinase
VHVIKVAFLRFRMDGMAKLTEDFYVDKSKILGKGNFGVVFKGYHLSENRLIAVKFMDRNTLDKCPDYER